MKIEKLALILFYSNFDNASQRVRVQLNESLRGHAAGGIHVREVDFDFDKRSCARYQVVGTPTIVVVADGRAVVRHLGKFKQTDLDRWLFHHTYRREQ